MSIAAFHKYTVTAKILDFESIVEEKCRDQYFMVSHPTFFKIDIQKF